MDSEPSIIRCKDCMYFLTSFCAFADYMYTNSKWSKNNFCKYAKKIKYPEKMLIIDDVAKITGRSKRAIEKMVIHQQIRGDLRVGYFYEWQKNRMSRYFIPESELEKIPRLKSKKGE